MMRFGVRRAAALLFALTGPAAAQGPRIVRGTVTDGAQPVPAVSVTAGNKIALSDDSGRFHLEIPHRDKLVLDFRRVGFLQTRYALDAGGDTTLSVLLLATAQRVPGVDVTANRDPAISLQGFEQRMRERQRGAGAGTFITAGEIQGSLATRATQVVQSVPSVSVHRVGSSDQYAIFGKIAGASECPAVVYLDGIRLGAVTEARTDRRGRVTFQRDASVQIDQYVLPNEIAGVEVYGRGLFAPPQFQPMGDPTAAKCAIVVFWTKHG